MDGRHLILDEPTATLPAKEKQSLWTLIRQLSDAGMAVVLISHFLQEVIDLCDEITVLQDGRKVSHLSNAGHEVTERQLIDLRCADPSVDRRRARRRPCRRPHQFGARRRRRCSLADRDARGRLHFVGHQLHDLRRPGDLRWRSRRLSHGCNMSIVLENITKQWPGTLALRMTQGGRLAIGCSRSVRPKSHNVS